MKQVYLYISLDILVKVPPWIIRVIQCVLCIYPLYILMIIHWLLLWICKRNEPRHTLMLHTRGFLPKLSLSKQCLRLGLVGVGHSVKFMADRDTLMVSLIHITLPIFDGLYGNRTKLKHLISQTITSRFLVVHWANLKTKSDIGNTIDWRYSAWYLA